jgi:hypothetical protein
VRLTFALRDSSAAQLVLGRKDRQFKAGVRKIVRAFAGEAHAIAFMLSAYRTGRMQRLLRVAFSTAGFAWRLGWRAIEFRREGQPFYAPWVVLGTSRQKKQDNLTPAFRHVRPRQTRALITFTRQWARRK